MRTANFDRVARSYRWMEYLSFGPWLVRCRNAQLRHLSGAQHALILGDGDGRFLDRLLAAFPTLTADVIDSSQTMLHVLDRRILRSGRQAHDRICLHHADALTCTVSGPYDLVISHFFLDCFFPEDLEHLIDRVLTHAAPQMEWVISEFALPQNAWLRWLGRRLIAWLYRAFGLLTGLPVRKLPDYATALLRRGFVLSHQRHLLAGLLCSEVWTHRQSAEHRTTKMV